MYSSAAGDRWVGMSAYAVGAGYAGTRMRSGIPGMWCGKPGKKVGALGRRVADHRNRYGSSDGRAGRVCGLLLGGLWIFL